MTFEPELIYVNYNNNYIILNIITIRFFLPGVTMIMAGEQGVAGNGNASHAERMYWLIKPGDLCILAFLL